MKTEVQLRANTLKITDLQNTDHIGFTVRKYGNGYVTANENRRLVPVGDTNEDTNPVAPVSTFGGKSFNDIGDLLNHISDGWHLIAVYRFDTRKELYQWLAE